MSAARGPFKPEHVGEGDRYEISRGHAVYSAPAGGRHGHDQLVGALPIATDPAVTEAGIDVGYAIDAHTLRAPDISVGNVPNAPGWVKGVPALAVEYADRGTDEDDLQTKIGELLAGGTQLVWVVRLTGPRRVDVHAQGRAPSTVAGGGMLDPQGILSKPLPVDALFDHDRANEVTFENLLARRGYSSLRHVHSEGHSEGHAQGRAAGLRTAIEVACEMLAIPLDEPRRARMASATVAELEEILGHLRQYRRLPD